MTGKASHSESGSKRETLPDNTKLPTFKKERPVRECALPVNIQSAAHTDMLKPGFFLPRSRAFSLEPGF